MAWGTTTASGQLTHTTEATHKALQASGGGDLIITVQDNETLALWIHCDNGAGTTDGMIVRIWGTLKDTPGAVPDSTQTYAGSDWALVNSFEIPADEGDEPVKKTIKGSYRKFALSFEPTGATDSWTTNVDYAIGDGS